MLPIPGAQYTSTLKTGLPVVHEQLALKTIATVTWLIPVAHYLVHRWLSNQMGELELLLHNHESSTGRLNRFADFRHLYLNFHCRVFWMHSVSLISESQRSNYVVKSVVRALSRMKHRRRTDEAFLFLALGQQHPCKMYVDPLK